MNILEAVDCAESLCPAERCSERQCEKIESKQNVLWQATLRAPEVTFTSQREVPVGTRVDGMGHTGDFLLRWMRQLCAEAADTCLALGGGCVPQRESVQGAR